MPIPTRSRSVRTASTQPQGQSQHEHATQEPVASHSVSSVAQHASRIARPPQTEKRSIPLPSSHGRSQSTSTFGLQTVLQTSQASRDTPLSAIPTGIRSTAHQRSQSVTTRSAANQARASDTSRAAVPSATARRPAETSSVSRSSLISRSTSVSHRQPTTLKAPFNTYQQRFSPKKPIQSSYPTTHSAQTVVDASTPQIADAYDQSSPLAAELLQLAIVHQGSRATLHRYEKSAGSHLLALESEASSLERAVDLLEQQKQADLNAQALAEWTQETVESVGINRLRDLSFCINELSAMNSPDGSFRQCMEEFDAWVQSANGIVSRQDTILASFLAEPLDAMWKNRAKELEDRLQICRRLLDDLGMCQADSRSAVYCTLEYHIRLCNVMASSLAEAQALSSALVLRQEQWLQDQITDVVAGKGSKPLAWRGGVWLSGD
jgi:hypothetical protein